MCNYTHVWHGDYLQRIGKLIFDLKFLLLIGTFHLPQSPNILHASFYGFLDAQIVFIDIKEFASNLP
jgi:hypothetical protein